MKFPRSSAIKRFKKVEKIQNLKAKLKKDMGVTLYRKYRPQKFKDVVGQDHIKIILENEISSGRLAHAYLFNGPRGTGKTTTARIFAKALNCEKRKDGESEPCGACDSCKETETGRAIDVIEMDAASSRGIDMVRENIIEKVRFAPARRKYKIFIIDEAHMLTAEAFNAFLKTLEEPPSYVVYILATTEIHKMPQTIVSRCQRFDFKKVPTDIIINRLKNLTQKEGLKISKEVLQIIAEHSEGCLRDAEGMLGQVLTLGDGKDEITFEAASLVLPHSDAALVSNLALRLLNKDAKSALEFIGKMSEEGVEINEFFNGLIKFFRNLIWRKISDTPQTFSPLCKGELEGVISEKQDELAASIDKAETGRLLVIVEILLEKKNMLGQTQIAELPLEIAAVKICSM